MMSTAKLCTFLMAVSGLGLAQAANATPTACPSGGTLDITAASDTPLSGTAYNVGQKATLTSVVAGGTATSRSWAIPGPLIKDYNDDLGTQTAAAAPLAWSTQTHSVADLTQPSVSLYWKPSAAQTHPLTGGPETRTVSLTATVNGASCTATLNVTVERNLTDPDRQPEDYYTSTHRASTTTNPGFGHIVDEHIYWHQFVGGGPTGNWIQFLAWHTHFLRRFDEWRAEFGYATVAPWYPGRRLPTGPEFDHAASLRIAYNPDDNRIPAEFTLAGSSATVSNGLASFTTLDNFSNSFEGGFHGQVHCSIGSSAGSFFATSGLGFGSMCKASSPKDPMFWRWHGFIDRLYRNYCKLKALACQVAPDPAANPWMGDNAADIAAGGVPPSPGPHWMSPDIWNRRAELTTDACVPRTAPPSLNTVGGVTRDCGTEADHENPLAGAPNFLYATLRNTGTVAQRNVYAEVAVYIANASTGLAWPADFTMLPESRQFITLNLEPGQVTSIGPLPWTPPSPVPSDHWCIYIRVLSVQEGALVEGTNVDTNVANSNSIAWRNLKIVTTAMKAMSAQFIVRNIHEDRQMIALDFAIPPELLRAGKVVVQFDPRLAKALEAGRPELGRVEPLGGGRFTIATPKASIAGLMMEGRGEGAMRLSMDPKAVGDATGDVIVTQRSDKGIDGGVTVRVAAAKRK